MPENYSAPSAGVYNLTGLNNGNEISGLATPEQPVNG